MYRLIVITTVLSAITVGACTAESATATTDFATSRLTPSLSPEIRAEDLREHVEFLASDDLAGRFPGTPGIDRAEEYIVDAFDQAGLETSLQEFTVYRHGFDSEETTVSFAASRSGSAAIHGEANRDFVPFWFSGTGHVDAEMVFAGYGITAPELGYDDYAGLDVTGKIVFILRHEPNENDPDSPFNGDEFSRHAFFVTKAENAHRHGAVGMVLVTDPLNHTADDFVVLPSMRRDESADTRRDRPNIADSFLAVHVSRSLARKFTHEWPVSIKDAQRRIDAGETPAEVGLPTTTASMTVAARGEPEPIAARNVLGIRSGQEDAPWIVFGAHHDHLGIGPGSGDTIYNGADDNASGVSAILELAAALQSAGGHNLLFVTFSAEEQGLFGSRYFVENSPIPVGEIAAMFNFDMIGRNSDGEVALYVGRAESATYARIEALLAERELAIDLRRGRIAAYSDHFPFYESGVQVFNFFAGAHEDYHEPTDSAEKLDYARMEDIVNLAVDIVTAITEEHA